jgi:hypothetical protein
VRKRLVLVRRTIHPPADLTIEGRTPDRCSIHLQNAIDKRSNETVVGMQILGLHLRPVAPGSGQITPHHGTAREQEPVQVVGGRFRQPYGTRANGIHFRVIADGPEGFGGVDEHPRRHVRAFAPIGRPGSGAAIYVQDRQAIRRGAPGRNTLSQPRAVVRQEAVDTAALAGRTGLP